MVDAYEQNIYIYIYSVYFSYQATLVFMFNPEKND